MAYADDVVIMWRKLQDVQEVNKEDDQKTDGGTLYR
jgi:hypothetical protein